MSMTPFVVSTKAVPLAVRTDGEAVVEIKLNETARRRPATPFERRVARQLREYFNGVRKDFDFPVRPEGSSFERKVWTELLKIPFGETRTYGEIAKKVGKPNAARAVGQANNKNPIPIAIPCHRVVANGGLGGYGGGLDLKKRLLELEGAGA